MIQKIDQAEKQTAMTKTMQDVTPDGFHPNYNGHRKWAEYILHEVIK
jgi:lysophospholipase L1-like esterase